MRCLRSIAPLVDHIIVVDTGSTDRTREIVSDFFSDFPGQLIERPWRDFAHNRSEALDLARQFGDYTFIIDADDILEFEPDFALPRLEADGYFIRIEDVATTYSRLQLVSNRLPWRYRGVLHEFLDSGGPNVTDVLHGLIMRRNHDGARRKNPETYIRDAEILEAALEKEPDPFMRSRYRFYLAQSYRDARKYDLAARNYLERSELGYWKEEAYVSLLEAARCMEKIERPYEEVMAIYERATGMVPSRAEALHGASRYARHARRFQDGFALAKRGLAIPKPQEGLFIEEWIYDYGMLDELAVNAYWTGQYELCLAACERILAKPNLPEEIRARIQSNRDQSRIEVERVAGHSAPKDDYLVELSKIQAQSEISADADDIVSQFRALIERSPARYEAPYWAARFCRSKDLFELGSDFAIAGLKSLAGYHEKPDNWIYDYGLLDELAVNSFWAGRHDVSFFASNELILNRKLPDAEFSRIYANREFAREKIASRLYPSVATSGADELVSTWSPGKALAGTELVVQGLVQRFPDVERHVQLAVNLFPDVVHDDRPLVLWMHHDVDQAAVQWCRSEESRTRVQRFVFVSNWQRERYLTKFNLEPEKCVVIRNATVVDAQRRVWRSEGPRRFAYISTPFRGLDVLLNAWERLNLPAAELHIWSSMKLYNEADSRYEAVINRCRSMPGVIYRGIIPNDDLKRELRDIHYLAYPCTFPETSCLAAIDAMAAGCRLIVPYLGALPETTAGFAHLYRWSPDAAVHMRHFEEALRIEVQDPWLGHPELSLAQQDYCELMYSWQSQRRQWDLLIKGLSA